MPENETIQALDLDEYKYGFVTEAEPVFRAQKGLSEEVVRQISEHKEEPEWMLDFRLKALEIYESKPMPKWGGDLSNARRGVGRDLLLRASPGPHGALLGRRAPGDQGHLREAGDPRGRA